MTIPGDWLVSCHTGRQRVCADCEGEGRGMVRKLGLLDLPSLGSVPSSVSLYDLGQIIFFSESEDIPLSHWENQNLHLTGDLTGAG